MPNPIYTTEFRLRAVQRVLDGESVASVCRDMGMSKGSLWLWRRAHEAAHGAGVSTIAETHQEAAVKSRMDAFHESFDEWQAGVAEDMQAIHGNIMHTLKRWTEEDKVHGSRGSRNPAGCVKDYLTSAAIIQDKLRLIKGAPGSITRNLDANGNVLSPTDLSAMARKVNELHEHLDEIGPSVDDELEKMMDEVEQRMLAS